MNKLYDRIDFENNNTPALNETNLNLMSKAIDDIDDRVVAIGGDVLEVIPQIQAYLEQADDLVEALELMTANPPYIGANGHWYVWDTETGAYVDSNIDASITVEIADITMLSPDATPYVTNTGTDTDPIFHLFIPRGQTGAAGQDGQDGISPTVTITTITGGHRITITDKDHPSGQSFDVMDGASGGVTSFNSRTGIVTPQSGDYTAAMVGAVASNGGEAGDTIVTFTDPSADGNITSGSTLKTIIGLIKYKLSHITGGGHTIINDAGTSMTQRAGLQFEGMGVTDDSTNDRTKVKLPIFNGTTAQWTALSSTEKAKYSVVNLTDDYGCEWQYLGSTNGSSGLTIPSNFKELLIFGKVATKYTTVPYLVVKDAYEVIKTAVGSSTQYVMPLYLSWLMQKSDATPPMYGVYVNAYIDGNYKIYGQSAYEVSGTTLTSKSYELIVYYR